MGLLLNTSVFLLVTIFLGYRIKLAFEPPPLPNLEETWWGNGSPDNQERSIRPFKIATSDELLIDLQYRLEHARAYTPPLERTQNYGMNGDLLMKIIDFWKTKYNWRQREEYLNKYPQFLINVQGLDIHYIHVKPKPVEGVRILPLLILHGWPGSVREFYEIIPILTTSREEENIVFEVIAPSIPGYGFSEPAVKPGLGAAQMGLLFRNFMRRLGFKKFYAQGGDFGAIILQNLATLYPESVYGFHNNMCTVTTPLALLKIWLGSIYPGYIMKEGHHDRFYPLGKSLELHLTETGYLHLQATKPDTLGVGLKDSPAALAAYILEKFITGTSFANRFREDGGLKESNFTDLLDNVMIYWITGSMPTAIRLYSETFNKKHMQLGVNRNPVTVPSACARFKNDFYAADGTLGEIYPNLLQLSDYEGGHFAAFEQPDLLANDIFKAVRKFEEFHRLPK